MSTIELHIGEMLQGDFAPGPVNVLLAFQVNCPGCFVHALPLAAKIHESYSERGINVLGLSTVFEDFELNTLEHSAQLLDDGRMVGETAKHFGGLGIERYETPILFPVAMDSLGRTGIGKTFAENGLPGTPTWIIFDQDRRVQGGWFGHKEPAKVMLLLDDMLSRDGSYRT